MRAAGADGADAGAETKNSMLVRMLVARTNGSFCRSSGEPEGRRRGTAAARGRWACLFQREVSDGHRAWDVACAGRGLGWF